MTTVRCLILRAPGTNCDVETQFAFQKAGAVADRVHIIGLLQQPSLLDQYQILCLPGGFSYGDDVAAGKILANQLRVHLADPLRRFRDAGKLVLGICNGFQVLVKAGLLPGIDGTDGPPATLTCNDSNRFEDRWTWLKVDPGRCAFLRRPGLIALPVAHGEGKFVTRDAATLRQLEANGQIVLRYAHPDGRPAFDYPANPNGSMGAVAGLCDPTGQILGLMPHPERHVDPTQHPQWTRRGLSAEGDGLEFFRNAVRHFQE